MQPPFGISVTPYAESRAEIVSQVLAAERAGLELVGMAPRTLELIDRLADGWIPGFGTDREGEWGSLGARIDAAAVAAGRDPASIRRIVNVGGVITDGAVEDGAVEDAEAGALEGPVDRWVETLVGWARDHRIDTFIVWPSAEPTATIERLAAEVAPAVRTALGD